MEATTSLVGNVIVSCFFGSNIKHEQIEGKKIPNFVKEMIGDLAVQIFDPLTVFLKIRLINWGSEQKIGRSIGKFAYTRGRRKQLSRN